ncbi:hypothetical protein [Vibrio sinaloensis]|uniref:hypothetical protein n=1 Tax=Photobacterium sp. (strain ATCC 43367) TaxID=379097 RepID=UPI0035E4D7D5
MFSSVNVDNFDCIYIVDSKYLFEGVENQVSFENDLILTFDFALMKYIEGVGGKSLYLDKLQEPNYMHKENHNIYGFFKDWHKDENGNDLFNYKGCDFGISFRLEYWNDFVYLCRLIINLSVLRDKKSKIHLLTDDESLVKALDVLSISYNRIDLDRKCDSVAESYFFPIAKWMESKVRPSGKMKLLYKVRSLINNVHHYLFRSYDAFFKDSYVKQVFIQEYHPTRGIINLLKDSEDVTPILANVTNLRDVDRLKKIRLIPNRLVSKSFELESKQIKDFYNDNKSQKLIIGDGIDITDIAYQVIEERVFSCLEEYVDQLDFYLNYIQRNRIDLNVIIANLGRDVTLFDCAARYYGVPSFLIINGLLGADFSDESKLANYINSYSESIKKNYFNNGDHVVVLGDPRMDGYHDDHKKITVDEPTIVIGTSGFNSVDLNSYVAVEFDFMFDVLTAIISADNYKEVIIKTRPNGYRQQYEAFVKDYFPSLRCRIEDTIPMKTAIMQADLYISIYSQTLFEASCVGVPTIYYRKDNQILSPPFDGRSELVTVNTIDELTMALHDFQQEHERFHPFLQPEVMEKYVGPLDGKNLERNVDFIREILKTSK